MTRRFFNTLAIAAIAATTFAPIAAEAGGSTLKLNKTNGEQTVGGLRGRPGGGTRPSSGPNSSPDNYPDKYYAECHDLGGGMITNEDGNYDLSLIHI